jgi:hypothetical protein
LSIFSSIAFISASIAARSETPASAATALRSEAIARRLSAAAAWKKTSGSSISTMRR